MAIDLKEMTVENFCDVQGLNKNDRNVAMKRYKNQVKSYEDWHTELSKHFKLSDQKDFTE